MLSVSQRQPHVQGVAVSLLYALFAATLVSDVAGGFIDIVAAGVTVGSVLGVWVGLVAEHRHTRRRPLSPWADEPMPDWNRFFRVGFALGALAGVLLALADAYLLR